MTPEQLSRDQTQDFATLVKGVETMTTKLANLDKDLRDDVLKDRTTEIRQETGKLLNPLLATMIGREKAAGEIARLHSRESELRRARFHNEDAVDATMQLAAFARLALTSTPELVEQLEDAVATNNLAMAEAIRLAFQSRTDRESVKDRFTAAFAMVKTPSADAAKAALGNVASLAGLAKERFSSAISGRSDPIGRLNAARLAVA